MKTRGDSNIILSLSPAPLIGTADVRESIRRQLYTPGPLLKLPLAAIYASYPQLSNGKTKGSNDQSEHNGDA